MEMTRDGTYCYYVLHTGALFFSLLCVCVCPFFNRIEINPAHSHSVRASLAIGECYYFEYGDISRISLLIQFYSTIVWDMCAHLLVVSFFFFNFCVFILFLYSSFFFLRRNPDVKWNMYFGSDFPHTAASTSNSKNAFPGFVLLKNFCRGLYRMCPSAMFHGHLAGVEEYNLLV